MWCPGASPSSSDVRIFCEAGIPGVICGVGPRTVLESNAKGADENLDLNDLRRGPGQSLRRLHLHA